MGVRGLTTFINRGKRFYENYHLNSTKVVIDGCGLGPMIYFDHDLDIDPGNHGGEHQMYYTHCAQFFRNMSACGVECYVIFDGSFDKDGVKFETLKRRAQESIDAIKELNETGEGGLTLASNHLSVLTNVMNDLDVQYVSSEFEADRDIAILANEFRCPVLGQDSDFFIMNIQEGYIPFDSLNWKQLCSSSNQGTETASCQPVTTNCQTNQNYLPCKRFRLRAFCSYFQVMPSMMPLFACLSGNDYVQGFNLREFYEGIKQRHQKPDGRPHPHRKGFWRFCNLLHHLTYFTTTEECIEEVLKYVDIDERPKVKAGLKESCSMYDVTCSSDVVEFFREQNFSSPPEEVPTNDAENPGSTCESTEEEGEKKEKVMFMPPICESILRQRTVFLNVQKEKLSKPRASACCDHLLRILAGIMLVNEVSKEGENESRKLTIDVFHRERYTLTCTKMEPKWNVSGFGNVPFYKEIPRMSESSRRSLLLAALNLRNISFDNIPESFHLILLASVYCHKKANPPLSKHLLHAVVLGWIQGVAWYQDNAQKLQREGKRQTEFDIFWDGYEVQTVLQNYGPLTRKSLQKSLDFDVSHGFMQWISCNAFTMRLNLLLQKVLPPLDIRIWYNGILIHNLYFRLKDIRPSRHRNWIENGLMLDAPMAYGFYQDIMSFFSKNFELSTNSKGESLKGSTGQQHRASQKEIQGHNGTTSKGTKETDTWDFSRGNSEKKKHRGSKKSRGKKGK